MTKKPLVKIATKTASDELQARIEELTADLQRLQAEFANYKRREGEAKAELLEMAKREVVTLLLPVIDNFERAMKHHPVPELENLSGEGDAKLEWMRGINKIYQQFEKALDNLGIQRIPTVGQPFDHNLHEAVSMEDGDGSREVVTEELQAGYRMGDTVIRHAMVKVGK